MNVKQFQALQSRVEELRSQADKSEGALEQLKKQLFKEHGCLTVKNAKRLLVQRIKEQELLESDYETALAEFEKEFPDVY